MVQTQPRRQRTNPDVVRAYAKLVLDAEPVSYRVVNVCSGIPLSLADALQTLGFAAVRDVHVGRYIVLEMDAADESSAQTSAREMCERLLANPVTEDFEIESIAAPRSVLQS